MIAVATTLDETLRALAPVRPSTSVPRILVTRPLCDIVAPAAAARRSDWLVRRGVHAGNNALLACAIVQGSRLGSSDGLKSRRLGCLPHHTTCHVPRTTAHHPPRPRTAVTDSDGVSLFDRIGRAHVIRLKWEGASGREFCAYSAVAVWRDKTQGLRLFGQEGTKLCGVFYTVVWRRDVLVAKRVAPSVRPAIFEIPDCGRSIGWDVLPISHGLLAIARHGRLFGDVVVTDGATIGTALDSVVRRCLA
jgi:hypothetical protein